MKSYHDLLRDILENGNVKEDRTGVGTISVFGRMMTFDLQKGFPLITTKKVHWKSVKGELLWFISGSTSAKELREKYGVTIWDEWERPDGELGPVYGSQWRKWDTKISTGEIAMWDDWSTGESGVIHTTKHIDQLGDVIEQLKVNPDSRRHLVSAWNPTDIPDMALPPCHYAFQFYVAPLVEGETKRRLSCMFHMRSTDVFLGLNGWAMML